jgi:hypothetical protein
VRILVALAVAAFLAPPHVADSATALVTVSSGPHAGQYTLRNTDVPCLITAEKPPHPKHQFSATLGGFTPSKDPKKLTMLMVIIPDADVHGANRSFFTSINFGDISRGTQYNAETRPGEKLGGSGSVTVATHGQDATVTFDVKSAEGVAYKGTIQCTGVNRY